MTQDALMYLIIAAVVVVVLAIAIPLFVSSSRKRSKITYDGPRDANDPAPVPGGAAQETQAERPGDVAVLEADPSGVEVVETVPAEPSLERPEPVQGRLARLRARLSKSNNVLGKGLLALLSRERIDASVAELRSERDAVAGMDLL